MTLGGAVASMMLIGSLQAAQNPQVEMHAVSADGVGESLGMVQVKESDHGLLLIPELNNLPAGGHGFHVHENASCEPGENDSGEMTPALSAGGHYDPDEAGSHEGPYGEGHLGDLPLLTVNDNGEAATPVLAPRLSVDDLDGRSLMIHEGGDNYSDDPDALGGGGSRIACGVIDLSS
nr:superoxide dismutase [Cu-Zn] SodC [Aidingimonas lacisalsi]